MKNRPLGALAIALALLMALSPGVMAGRNYPDPCSAFQGGNRITSPLCAALIEQWSFEEPSDYPRAGAFMTLLLERLAKNVASIAEIKAGLDGSSSLDLESTDQSWLWQFGSIPARASAIAVWFKTESLPASPGQRITIVSSNTTNAPGPELYVEKTSTSAKICYGNYEEETDTALTVCSANDSVANATVYHVVAGESPYHIGKSRLYLSLNGGTLLTTAGDYHTRSGVGILDVGAHRSHYDAATFSQHFDGQLDQLALWARPLTPAEISLLYNSGNGLSYPFNTD